MQRLRQIYVIKRGPPAYHGSTNNVSRYKNMVNIYGKNRREGKLIRKKKKRVCKNQKFGEIDN